MMTPDRIFVAESCPRQKSCKEKDASECLISGIRLVLRHLKTSSQKRRAATLMNKYLIVGIGGFIAAIARFWLGAYLGDRMGTRFPYGTFIINCTGSFLVGFIITVLAERTHWSPN